MIVDLNRRVSSFLLGGDLGLGEEGRLGEGSLVADHLDVGAVVDEGSLSGALEVVEAGELGESPLVRHDDPLTAGEFVLGPSEGLEGLLDVGLSDPHGVEDGSDFDSRGLSVGLSEGASHAGLQSISACAGQHLVDSEHVPGVHAASHVEVILADVLGQVFVAGDAAGLEGLGGDLLDLVGDDVDDEGEVGRGGLLAADVVDADLGVGDTAVVAGFGVGLAAADAVATSWSSAHSV